MAEQRPVINTKDSQTSGAYSKDGNTWNVDAQQVDSYTQQLIAQEEQLPANQDSDQNVHWLGSSFSGADIKIVVHMYEDIELGHTNNLKQDQQLYQDLVDAYNNIILHADGIVSSQGYNISNLDIITNIIPNAEPAVIGHLLSFLNTFSGLSPSVRAVTIRNAAEGNIHDYEAMSESAGNNLADLESIEKDQYSTFTLATAQTFSIQTHREKNPVRALGHANVKGWTRGNRTIAGSIVFTMFNEHALAGLIRKMGSAVNKFDPSPANTSDVSSLLADQLPPVDITIVFANEYGALSRAAVYGVEFMNSGVTLSIEDILTEEVVNFVARDADPVVSLGRVGIDRKQRGMHFNREGAPTTGTDLIFASKSAYDEYLDKLKVRRKLRNR